MIQVQTSLLRAKAHIVYSRPPLTDAIHHLESSNKQEIDVFADQFQKDWETFPMMRAKELLKDKVFIQSHTLVDLMSRHG